MVHNEIIRDQMSATAEKNSMNHSLYTQVKKNELRNI